MSINTITPTFNNHVPHSEVDRIKAASDANDTDDLTLENKGRRSSHGEARIEVDKIRDERLLRKELDEWSHCKDIH